MHAALPDAHHDALSVEERRSLQHCYDEGMKLMQQAKYDNDRVHGLLLQCVLRDPGNLMYVDALLANLARKFGNRNQVPHLQLFTGKGPLQKAANQADWEQVLRHGPDVLKHNPWDVEVLWAMIQACAARGFNQAELRYLQQALDAEATDAETNRQLAQAFARRGHFEEAIQCWQRVESADPYDAEAPRAIATLTLERARREPDAERARPAEAPAPVAGEAGPARPAAAGKAAAPEAEKKKPRQLVLTRRQQLEQAVINTPEDEQAYLELAEYYLSEHHTYEAQRTLVKALNVSRDLRILERLEDVNMQRAREQIEIAQQRADAEKTDEAKALVQKLKEEAARLELQIYTSRCGRYPNDHRLKFQVGLRLKRVGNFRQALEPLQGGLEIPEHRAEASLEIGEILQSYKMFPKALQCYRQAVQLAGDDEKQLIIRKRALYRAGVLADSMRIPDSAKQYFSELVRLDPGFRDAKARLDKLDGISENP
jgi:tetratricopeptide (TPR) repeat protein